MQTLRIDGKWKEQKINKLLELISLYIAMRNEPHTLDIIMIPSLNVMIYAIVKGR
jgi:hypothetical protein